MSYVIDVHSDEDSQVIENAFDFVKDSSTISITDLSAPKEEVIVLKEEVVEVKEPTKKEKKQASKNKKAPAAVKQTNFIRIEASKVDSLINLIGEMVISNASVMQKATDLKNSELVMRNSFFIGVYPGLDEFRLNYVVDVFERFFEEAK